MVIPQFLSIQATHGYMDHFQFWVKNKAVMTLMLNSLYAYMLSSPLVNTYEFQNGRIMCAGIYLTF